MLCLHPAKTRLSSIVFSVWCMVQMDFFGTYFHLATQIRVVVCDVRLKCVFRKIFSLGIVMFWFSIFFLNNCIRSEVSTRLGNRLMDLFGLSPPHLIESLRSWMGRLKFFSIFLGQQIFPFRDTKYFPETTNTSNKYFDAQQEMCCLFTNIFFYHISSISWIQASFQSRKDLEKGCGINHLNDQA